MAYKVYVTIKQKYFDNQPQLEYCWIQYPLPLVSGEVMTVVVIRTRHGDVAVRKDWFDKYMLIGNDGPAHWQALLSLLEAQAAQQVKEYALDYLVREGE